MTFDLRLNVKVGSLPGTFYRDQVGGSIEKRRNPLENPDQNSEVNRCLKTSVTVKVKTYGRDYPTNFELDPLKCFNSDAELQFEEGEDENTILLNLTQQIATNEKLFDLCLIGIKILDEDNEEVPFEKVSGYSPVKITALRQLRKKGLTVEYNFRGSITRTKVLNVPATKKGFNKLL